MNPYELIASPACTPIITPADCGPLAANPVSPTPVAPQRGCTPVLTPGDCGPTAPSSAPSTPADTHRGGVERVLDWMDTHPHPGLRGTPGASTGDSQVWAQLGEILAGTAVTLGAMATVVGIGWVSASRLGWDARRLRNFAAASMTLPVATVVAQWDWRAPVQLLLEGAACVADGELRAGIAALAITMIPAGLMIAALLWARYSVRVATIGKRSVSATERAQRRRTNAKLRMARELASAPTPLTVVTGWIRPHRWVVLGRLAEEITQQGKSAAAELVASFDTLFKLAYADIRKHLMVVGGPGSGKTTLLSRLVIAVHVAAQLRYLRAAAMRPWLRTMLRVTPKRPLTINTSCKGGHEDLRVWAEQREAILATGMHPSKIAMFPQTKLNLFGMPVDSLRYVLEKLCPSEKATDAGQAFFEQMRISLVHLIVDAPDPDKGLGPGQNKPKNSQEFLDRFDQPWLWHAWGGHLLEAETGVETAESADEPDGGDTEESKTPKAYLRELHAVQAMMEGKQPVLPAETARFSNLFRELGDAFDGDTGLLDKQYWFVTVPGTANKSVASAQMNALIAMVEQTAATKHGHVITFTIDELSRVDANVYDAAEALRSQDVALILGYHSYESIAATDREAARTIKGCAGGVIACRSEGADDILKTFGTRRAIEPSRHTLDGKHGSEGSVRMQDSFLVDPNLLRRIEPGDCVHVNAGTARWGRVARLDTNTIPLLASDPITHTSGRGQGRARTVWSALIHGQGDPA
ncbi:hypothetical protein [Nocardia brasiliensis]|uniref:hypothetical protein n=1 Tax=Nocardia brasiliensis TaxID=37326 RepID=UPI0024564F73|nr:hypothetical protein [Nocardia brasiliensis]